MDSVEEWTTEVAFASRRWMTNSSGCTTSLRSISAPAASSGPRRCCAGMIRTDGLLDAGHFLHRAGSRRDSSFPSASGRSGRPPRTASAGSDLGLPRLRLGINVSPRRFSIASTIRDAFDTLALRACCDLYLEIDGREISGAPDDVIRTLHTLQFEGVNIAVQGFGADETLRSRLWALPVDVVEGGSRIRSTDHVRRHSADRSPWPAWWCWRARSGWDRRGGVETP